MPNVLFSAFKHPEKKGGLKAIFKEAPFYSKLSGGTVQCLICPRKCVLKENRRGFCGAYLNLRGKLVVDQNAALYAAFPSTHGQMVFKPNDLLLQVCTPNCNSRCSFCWYSEIATEKVENVIGYEGTAPFGEMFELNPYTNKVASPLNYRRIPPSQLIEIMQSTEWLQVSEPCKGLNFVSAEPAIRLNYVLECSKLCHEAGGVTLLNTSGAISKQTVQMLAPVTDSVKISFKNSGVEPFYKKHCSGIPAKSVFASAKLFHELGVHVQLIDTLQVGDPPANFRHWASWVAKNLGPQTCVLAAPMQPMPEYAPFYLPLIERIAQQEGLEYFFLDYEKSGFQLKCPECGSTLIREENDVFFSNFINMKIFNQPTRFGTIKNGGLIPIPLDRLLELNVDKNGRCKNCGRQTPIIV